jgi:predicted SnoaL-like aldol condensation-catalyzing enzyme
MPEQQQTSSEREEPRALSNKESAIAFLQMASSGSVREAYAQYVHPQFIHHNSYFPGDRESLMLGMEQNAKEFPNKQLEVLRSLEDGDLVAVHSRIRMNPESSWMVVIHLFRFEDAQIIEAWEAGQEVPADSPNQNGAF